MRVGPQDQASNERPECFSERTSLRDVCAFRPCVAVRKVSVAHPLDQSTGCPKFVNNIPLHATPRDTSLLTHFTDMCFNFAVRADTAHQCAGAEQQACAAKR